jgi:hypothetical protein
MSALDDLRRKREASLPSREEFVALAAPAAFKEQQAKPLPAKIATKNPPNPKKRAKKSKAPKPVEKLSPLELITEYHDLDKPSGTMIERATAGQRKRAIVDEMRKRGIDPDKPEPNDADKKTKATRAYAQFKKDGNQNKYYDETSKHLGVGRKALEARGKFGIGAESHAVAEESSDRREGTRAGLKAGEAQVEDVVGEVIDRFLSEDAGGWLEEAADEIGDIFNIDPDEVEPILEAASKKSLLAPDGEDIAAEAIDEIMALINGEGPEDEEDPAAPAARPQMTGAPV